MTAERTPAPESRPAATVGEAERPARAVPADAVGRTTVRLRFFFLIPLTVVIVAVAVIWVTLLYHHQIVEMRDEAERIKATLRKLYDADVAHSAEMLNAVMQVLARDETLRMAIAQRDRRQLLARAAPLFADLRGRFGVTHFYFTGPDRVNLLRVHMPDRHGDVIDRFTTLEAGRTRAIAHGVELGPLGTFTLRLVSPWYADAERRRLLGYVELGMEIDHVLHGAQHFLELPIFVLVSKEHLRRADWEAGMKMLGRTADWDRFPDAVLGTQAAQTLPAPLAERFARVPLGEMETDFSVGRAYYRTSSLPLRDAAGRVVGRMVAMIDQSHMAQELRRAAYSAGAIALGAAGLLFGFFYWLVGSIGRRLERQEHMLEELATHDGLTGLYNHRTFHTLLGDELARATRFGRPASLLMLDIDRFKSVNDTHGHQAGDAILRGLSSLLTRQARAIDRVCRYGGEEFTVILPETDADIALNIAERLRATVERQPFDIGEGRAVHINVSIGVASFPSQAESADALVAAADAALYAAKQAGRNRVARYEPSMKAAGEATA